MKKYKKIIIVVAIFFMVTLTSAGTSAWLILSEIEQALDQLTTLDSLAITYSPESGTSMYAGESFTPSKSATVKYGIAGLGNQSIKGSWKFDLKGDGVYQTVDEILRTASGSSSEIDLNLELGTEGVITCPAKFILDKTQFGSLFLMNNDYVIPNVTVTFPKLNAVATIGSTYYATIDGALTAAISNNTINVLALGADVDQSNAKQAKTITKNVGNGVTLYVAYDNSVSDEKTLAAVKTPTIQCTNHVFIGTNITNYGTITIPAVITGKQKAGGPNAVGGVGSAGTGSSKVDGNYSQITCLNNTKITSTGTINCYGYIVGDVELNDSAKMTTVFSFLDHVGGTKLLPIVTGKKTFPIKRYYIASVQGSIKISSTASLLGFVDINMSSRDFENTIAFIDQDNGFVALESTSYAIINYSSGKNRIDIYGSASLNPMSVTVSGYTVSTTQNWLPISYLWDVALHPINSSTTATVTAGKDNHMALLPGATLTIDKGVTLKANNLAIYKSCTELNTAIISGFGYGNFDAAKVTVNGSLSASNIGGPIIAGNDGASISYTGNSVSYQEVESTGTLGHEYYTVSLSAEGSVVLHSGSSLTSTTRNNLPPDTYFGLEYTSGKYAWYPDGITISLDATVGTITPTSVTRPTPATTADLDSTIPSYSHGTFSHWCINTNCSNSASCMVRPSSLYADVKLYAQWTPKTYTLSYAYKFDGFDTAPSIPLPSELPTSFTFADTISLPTPTSDYEFGGWYIDEACTQAIINSTIKGVDLLTVSNGNATIYGLWVAKQYTITYENAADSNIKPELINGTQTFTDNQIALGATLKPIDSSLATNTSEQYYFGGWLYNGSIVTDLSFIDTSSENLNYTLVAQWIKKAHFTVGSFANISEYSVSYNGETFTNPDTFYAKAGDTFIVTATATSGYENPQISVGTVTGKSSPYTHTVTTGDVDSSSTNEISGSATQSSSGGGCVTGDTLITLADGTQKKVEDLTMDDVLLVFNHETGEYEAAGIIFIENDGWNYYNVINLTFSNGTTTKLIYEHALFDVTLNKYVYITEANYADFVGHEFAVQSADGFEVVTLTEAFVAEEYTGCYSLVTVYHLNYFINGLFSIPGGITGLFNFFEYGDNLVYNEEKMQADIEEYGVFTYEDFAEYLPEELYEMFPAAYLKVAIGKGMVTFDEILEYIDQFLVKNGLM